MHHCRQAVMVSKTDIDGGTDPGEIELPEQGYDQAKNRPVSTPQQLNPMVSMKPLKQLCTN